MTRGRIAVFLDRDGTVNEEVNFVRKPEELVLIPGAASAIRSLNEQGLITCVISNQSGIARGFFTEDDLVHIHAKLEHDLRASGAHVDRIYYCPHHPTEGMTAYTRSCSCRKPSPGMLLQAQQEFDLDLTRSFVVGDRIGDIQVARATGAKSILVLTGYGANAIEECNAQGCPPDFVAPALLEAVAWITQQIKGETDQNG